MTVGDLYGARVVVTGAAGFIGSHLVQGRVDRNLDVVGIDRRSPRSDALAELNLREVLSHPRFSLVEGDLLDTDLNGLVDQAGCVFHLAAVPGVRSSWARFQDCAAA